MARIDDDRTICERHFIVHPDEFDLELAAGNTAEALVSLKGRDVPPFRLLVGKIVARRDTVGFKSKQSPVIFKARHIRQIRYFEYL